MKILLKILICLYCFGRSQSVLCKKKKSTRDTRIDKKGRWMVLVFFSSFFGERAIDASIPLFL